MTKAEEYGRWFNLRDRLQAELSDDQYPQGPFMYAEHTGGRGEPIRYVFQDKVCLGVREAIAYAEFLFQRGV